jgi:type I restriction enzyme S subunit
MKDWKEYKIGDLCEVGRGSSPRPIIDQRYFKEGTIPWIKIADATASGKYIYETNEHVNEFGASFSRYLDEGSLIIAASGVSLGQIKFLGVKGCIHDGWLYTSNFDIELIDKEFLYYFLIYYSEGFHNFSSGAAIQNINTDILRKTVINLPPLPTQRRITSILSTYDELIEVNNQRIKLLGETASELYKEWFVRMRFPGHKQAKFVKGVPLGWRVKPIGKVIDYNIGGGWGSDDKNNVFSSPGYVIRGTDIPGVRIGKANQEVYRFHKASNLKSRELIEGDIVFETAGGSEGQLLGRTCYITQELLDSYGDKVMAASFCKQIRTTSIPSLYLYYFLNYLYDTGMVETFQVQSTGISNYQFVPFLKFQQIILPDDDLMQSFHDKTLLMQKQIAILGQQNNHLRQIRDRLLPRLISGKLEVKKEKVLLNSETETKYN